jgi:hypothetical protein
MSIGILRIEVALCLIGLGAAAGCSEWSATGTTGTSQELSPILPDTAPVAAARQQVAAQDVVRKTPHPLAAVASVIAATVESVTSTYDERLGPRQVFALENIVVYAGKAPSTTSFSQLGGELPGGRTLGVSEFSQYEAGKRYVFCFARRASLYTAVWGGFSFQVETLGGREFALGEDGRALLSFTTHGAVEGTTDFFLKPDIMAAGSRRELAEARQGTGLATGDRTDLASEPELPGINPHPGVPVLREDIKPSAEELARALTADGLGAAVRDAALQVGAPLGEDFSLDPPPDVRWGGSHVSEL